MERLLDLAAIPGERHLIVDVSGVRPMGAPLKTFGGTASGPGPLLSALVEVAKTVNATDRLTPIDLMVVDHHIAACVVAGNVRRSARMSILHWNDPYIFEFIRCKADHMLHWSTNISTEVDDAFFAALEAGDPHAWRVFEETTAAMFANGEPGFYNSSLASVGERHDVRSTNPCFAGDAKFLTEDGWRRFDDMLGKDPKILQDQRVSYDHDAEAWVVNKRGQAVAKPIQGFDVRITGLDKDVFTLRTSCGRVTYATGDHHFATPDGMRQLDDLKPGDRILVALPEVHRPDSDSLEYRAGLVSGLWVADGTTGAKTAIMSLWDHKIEAADDVERTVAEWIAANPGVVTSAPVPAATAPAFKSVEAPDTTVKISMQSAALYRLFEQEGIVKDDIDWLHLKSKDFKAGFVSGFFHGDGSVQDSNQSPSFRFAQSNEALLRNLMLVLQELGVLGRLYRRHEARSMVFREGQKAYDTKPTHELIVSGYEQCRRLVEVISLYSHHDDRWAALDARQQKASYASKYWAKVESIDHRSTETVYCLTENVRRTLIADGLTARRCGEIALEDWESCNLGHVNLAAFPPGTEGDLQYAARLMTRFLLRATNAPHTDERSAEVEHRNRRLGVGVFGFQEWALEHGVKYSEIPESTILTEKMRALAATVDREADAYSAALGVPRPIKTRTVAPTGTIAKLPGTTEGIHPVYSRYFERRIRYATSDGKWREFEASGHAVEDCIYSANTKVVVFHVADPITQRFADDMIEQPDEISVDRMLAVQAWVQEHWADNAVSFTVNIDPALDIETLRGALRNFLPRLKGTTVFPDLSRPQSPYVRISKEQYLAAIDHSVGQGEMDCASGACPIK